MSTRSEEFLNSIHVSKGGFTVDSSGEATRRGTELTPGGMALMIKQHKEGKHDPLNTSLRWKDGSPVSTDDLLTVRSVCPLCKGE